MGQWRSLDQYCQELGHPLLPGGSQAGGASVLSPGRSPLYLLSFPHVRVLLILGIIGGGWASPTQRQRVLSVISDVHSSHLKNLFLLSSVAQGPAAVMHCQGWRERKMICSLKPVQSFISWSCLHFLDQVSPLVLDTHTHTHINLSKVGGCSPFFGALPPLLWQKESLLRRL